MTPLDDRWVGAWWMGYILISVPCVLFGSLVCMFPRNIRKKGPTLPEENKMITNLNNFEKSEVEKTKEPDYSWSGTYRRTLLHTIITLLILIQLLLLLTMHKMNCNKQSNNGLPHNNNNIKSEQ